MPNAVPTSWVGARRPDCWASCSRSRNSRILEPGQPDQPVQRREQVAAGLQRHGPAQLGLRVLLRLRHHHGEDTDARQQHGQHDQARQPGRARRGRPERAWSATPPRPAEPGDHRQQHLGLPHMSGPARQASTAALAQMPNDGARARSPPRPLIANLRSRHQARRRPLARMSGPGRGHHLVRRPAGRSRESPCTLKARRHAPRSGPARRRPGPRARAAPGTRRPPPGRRQRPRGHGPPDSGGTFREPRHHLLARPAARREEPDELLTDQRLARHLLTVGRGGVKPSGVLADTQHDVRHLSPVVRTTARCARASRRITPTVSTRLSTFRATATVTRYAMAGSLRLPAALDVAVADAPHRAVRVDAARFVVAARQTISSGPTTALPVVGVGVGAASRVRRHFGDQLAQQPIAELLEDSHHDTDAVRHRFHTDFIRAPGFRRRDDSGVCRCARVAARQIDRTCLVGPDGR